MTDRKTAATRAAAPQTDETDPRPAETAPTPETPQDLAEGDKPPVDETTEQAQAEAVEVSPTDKAVDDWFAGFNDSALSRNPEFWNLVRERLPDLKSAIATA